MTRRWSTTTVLAGVAALTLTGCAPSAGVDGDLSDGWGAPPEPVSFVPAAGACHPVEEEIGFLSTYDPVDCAESHLMETVHVGEFTGPDTDGATPPPSGSPGMRAARADCEQHVNDLLGGPWRSGPMTVRVVPPSGQAWSGGVRWFRCDLGQIRGLENPDLLVRTGDLKDALGEGSELAYHCFRPTFTGDDITEMAPSPCTEKHEAEFVGVWTAPESSYTAFANDTDRQHRECRKVIAAFAKVPDDSDLVYRVGTIIYQPTEAEWADGSRGSRCFLWRDTPKLTSSIKGAGTRGLPINYA